MIKYLFLLTIILSITYSISGQTLVPYLKKNGKYIYVDSITMSPVINKEFKNASLFNSGGVAYVEYDNTNGKSNYACINKSGDFSYIISRDKNIKNQTHSLLKDDLGDFVLNVTNYEIHVKEQYPGYEEKTRSFFVYNSSSDIALDYFQIFSFNQGRLIVSKLNKRRGGSEPSLVYGVLDLNGKEILPPIYWEIRNYKDGMAAVKTENGWGFIDLNGNEVVLPKFNSVSDFDHGRAEVSPKSGEKYLIDLKGTKVYPQNIINSYQYYSNSGKIYFEWSVNGYENVGLKNIKAKKVIPVGKYQVVGKFLNGYAFVKSTNGFGIIDTLLNEVVPPKYDEVGTFHEGLVKVKSLKGFTFVDTKGVECFSSINPNNDQELSDCFNGYVSLINKRRYDQTIYFDKKGRGFYEK